jgi:hypothetical protein
MRRAALTALSSLVVPYDIDRPDEEDPSVVAVAEKLAVSPKFLADVAEETTTSIFRRLGTRPPMPEVLDALREAGLRLQGKQS